MSSLVSLKGLSPSEFKSSLEHLKEMVETVSSEPDAQQSGISEQSDNGLWGFIIDADLALVIAFFNTCNFNSES